MKIVTILWLWHLSLTLMISLQIASALFPVKLFFHISFIPTWIATALYCCSYIFCFSFIVVILVSSLFVFSVWYLIGFPFAFIVFSISTFTFFVDGFDFQTNKLLFPEKSDFCHGLHYSHDFSVIVFFLRVGLFVFHYFLFFTNISCEVFSVNKVSVSLERSDSSLSFVFYSKLYWLLQ